MKCLVVIHYPIFGGPHNRVLRMSSLLKTSGWETVVVIPDEEGNAKARLASGDCEVIPLPIHRLRGKLDPRWAARYALGVRTDVSELRRIIRDRSIDLVVVGGLANPQGAIAAELEGVPLVWQIIDSRTPRSLRASLMPLVMKLSDGLMFGGEALVDLHLRSRRIDCPPIAICPPAVDTRRFIPSGDRRASTRSELGIPNDALVVGTVANINAQKGIEYFIRTAALLLTRSDTYFLIVGSFSKTQEAYTRQLHREVKALGIPPDRLIFTGDRADVENYYPAMDVKLITSLPRSEGTTTTAMEAMACGVPVVAADVGAVKEVVIDEQTGLIVPPLDPAAFANATSLLLDDAELRSRMGGTGRTRATEVFDLKISVSRYLSLFERAILHRRTKAASRFEATSPLRQSVEGFEGQSLLACPACRGQLTWLESTISCHDCGHTYCVVEGIPVLLKGGTDAEGQAQKREQARYFDSEVTDEFEITRPHGAPRFHRWLLSQKFLRSVRGLRDVIDGRNVLTVCGGSGMEAEFLARLGAKVIVSDISLGAAKRVRERAHRTGLPLSPIVADAECLPLANQSIDCVFVHDGLHHLVSPTSGLREMCRVARSAVSVTEPAEAFATKIAILFGISERYEESGNRVARLRISEVISHLRNSGFDIQFSERYAMFYRHEPGAISKILSRKLTYPVATASWSLANRAIGRFGNKLAVVATRVSHSEWPNDLAAPPI